MHDDLDLCLAQARLIVIGFEERARAASGIHLSVNPKNRILPDTKDRSPVPVPMQI